MSHIAKSITIAQGLPLSPEYNAKDIRPKMFYLILRGILSVENVLNRGAKLSEVWDHVRLYNLGISRDSVRNALRSLEYHGLLFRPNNFRLWQCTLTGLNVLNRIKTKPVTLTRLDEADSTEAPVSRVTESLKKSIKEATGYTEPMESEYTAAPVDTVVKFRNILRRRRTTSTERMETLDEKRVWSLAYIIFVKFMRKRGFAEGVCDLTYTLQESAGLNPQTWNLSPCSGNVTLVEQAMHILVWHKLITLNPAANSLYVGPFARMMEALMKVPEMPEEFEDCIQTQCNPSNSVPEFVWLTVQSIGDRIVLVDELVTRLTKELHSSVLPTQLYSGDFLKRFRKALYPCMIKGQDAIYIPTSAMRKYLKEVEEPTERVVEDYKKRVINWLREQGPVWVNEIIDRNNYVYGRRFGAGDAVINLWQNVQRRIEENVHSTCFRGKEYLYVSDDNPHDIYQNTDDKFITYEGNFFDQTQQGKIYPIIGWGSHLCFVRSDTLLEGNTFKPGDKPYVLKQGMDGYLHIWKNGRWIDLDSLQIKPNIRDSRFRILNALIVPHLYENI